MRDRLLWVDIPVGTVHVGQIADGDSIEVEELVTIPDTASAVAVSAAGDWLIAGSHRLYTRTADGELAAGPALLDRSGRRFNDGKPDPAGRFVVGTKGPGDELLLRIEPDGAATVLDDDLRLSNGVGWTRDGLTMYSVDTLIRRVYVRDYDPATGAVGDRRTFLELADGYPDGMTLDSEDHLWIAQWGKGRVIRVSPEGAVVGRIDVPAPQVSCPVFAGPDLGTLVVTTATEDMSPDERAAHPLSGHLFTLRTGYRGVEPDLWAGTPRPTVTLEESS